MRRVWLELHTLCLSSLFELFELQSLLVGMILIYVDLMGVYWKKDLQSELSKARLMCTSLLGPTAVSYTKTQSGRRLDIIGYLIDLDKGLVSIAKKNFLKALHGFFMREQYH